LVDVDVDVLVVSLVEITKLHRLLCFVIVVLFLILFSVAICFFKQK